MRRVQARSLRSDGGPHAPDRVEPRHSPSASAPYSLRSEGVSEASVMHSLSPHALVAPVRSLSRFPVSGLNAR